LKSGLLPRNDGNIKANLAASRLTITYQILAFMKAEPIDSLLKPLSSFIKSETTAGVVLFVNTVIALVLANSPLASEYQHFWHEEFSISIAGHTIANTLHHWINDGLMSMFFFVIGLELKREVMGGDLSTPKQAMLPLAAAVGGMVVPAILFIVFNQNAPERSGWGIPMATDIAFALGILAILSKRVPTSLKILLTALAIADDLGAVLVIALFYTSDISVISLLSGGVFIAILIAGNLLGIRNVLFYGVIGIGGLWLAFLFSGVHATIAGVLAALTIPARAKVDEVRFTRDLKDHVEEFSAVPPNDVSLLEPEQLHVIEKIKTLIRAAETPLQRLEHSMHPVIAFIILPLFALANAGIEFSSDFIGSLVHPVSMGVIAGLVLGKSVGIIGACWITVKMKWAQLPESLNWGHIIGVGFLGGIGFTMSLFITNLAFQDEELNLYSKTGIVVGSLIAGIVGFVVLRTSKK
jgi:NhaA family Na+:H+ antiporter